MKGKEHTWSWIFWYRFGNLSCIALLDCTLPEARNADRPLSVIYVHSEALGEQPSWATRGSSSRVHRCVCNEEPCADGLSSTVARTTTGPHHRLHHPWRVSSAILQHRWDIQLPCFLSWPRHHSNTAQERTTSHHAPAPEGQSRSLPCTCNDKRKAMLGVDKHSRSCYTCVFPLAFTCSCRAFCIKTFWTWLWQVLFGHNLR